MYNYWTITDDSWSKEDNIVIVIMVLVERTMVGDDSSKKNMPAKIVVQ